MPTRRKQKNLVQTLVSDEMLMALEREQERRAVTMSQLLREIIYDWSSRQKPESLTFTSRGATEKLQALANGIAQIGEGP